MKVFVYVSHWHDGVEFEGGIFGKAFATREEAESQLAADKAQAIEMINDAYDGYYDEDKDGYSIVGDSDEFQNDWWEGEITENEI